MRALLAVLLIGCGARTELATPELAPSSGQCAAGAPGSERVLVTRSAYAYLANPVADVEQVYFSGSGKYERGVFRVDASSGGVEKLESWPASQPAVTSYAVAWVLRGDPPRVTRVAGRSKEGGAPFAMAEGIETTATVTRFVGAEVGFFVAFARLGAASPDDPAGVFDLAERPPKLVAAGNATALAANRRYVAFILDNALLRRTRSSGEVETTSTDGLLGDVALASEEVVFVENGALIAAFGPEGRRVLSAPIGASRIAADASHVYAATPSGVHRIPLAGGSAEVVRAETGVTDLTIDRCAIYWISERGIVRHAK